jgi:hypothetical protein
MEADSGLVIGAIVVFYFFPLIMIYCFFTPAGMLALHLLWIGAVGLIIGMALSLVMGFVSTIKLPKQLTNIKLPGSK